MECPRLKGVGKGIQDPIMRVHLENMDRDECVEDDCESFEECWGSKDAEEKVV